MGKKAEAWAFERIVFPGVSQGRGEVLIKESRLQSRAYGVIGRRSSGLKDRQWAPNPPRVICGR